MLKKRQFFARFSIKLSPFEEIATLGHAILPYSYGVENPPKLINIQGVAHAFSRFRARALHHTDPNPIPPGSGGVTNDSSIDVGDEEKKLMSSKANKGEW